MILPFIFSLLIVIADQAVKWWISTSFALGEIRAMIPGLMSLTHVRNTGAAFSLLREHTWLLTLISAVFAVFLIIVLAKRYFEHPVAVWSLSLIHI